MGTKMGQKPCGVCGAKSGEPCAVDCNEVVMAAQRRAIKSCTDFISANRVDDVDLQLRLAYGFARGFLVAAAHTAAPILLTDHTFREELVNGFLGQCDAEVEDFAAFLQEKTANKTTKKTKRKPRKR